MNINVYYQAWNERIPSINYGDNGLRLLDDTVRQAEETGIKLILTLSNNWEAYGGMDLWVNNVIGRGAPHDLFYTDARIMQYFKDYVRIIVERYRDSEAIFAWELTNEARCYGPGSNPSSGACKPSTVTSWARNMSDYIKSLDSNHMVSFGSEGFMNRPDTANGEYQYDGSTGGDYDAEIRLPSIDFGTIHLYPGYSPGVDLAWTLEFLAKHDTSSFEAGKPAVLEEYGVSRFENGTFPRAGTYSAWHELILASRAFQGDMTWATLVVRGECPGGNEFAICEDDPDFDQLVTDWTERMNGKAL
ncbi:MAG: hypothetical protein M1832_002641 [Thelocarpon impressellum]|nr:MAG: hypothetical protein M1832_002641 [Thelocarpon impressellum]